MSDLIFRQTVIDVILCEPLYKSGMEDRSASEVIPEIYLKIKALPPAEPIHINLNDYIKVKLTDLGKDIYYRQLDDINKLYGTKYEPAPLKEDENGYVKFQLWDFMQLYGPHMGMAKDNVIEPIEIIYEPQ